MHETRRDPDRTSKLQGNFSLWLVVLVAVTARIGAAVGAWGAVLLFRPTISAEVAESGTLVPDGLPADDAAGEDLADLPRFPGAVRCGYRIDTQADLQVTETEYVADAPMDEVRVFYQDALAENGWSLAELEYSLGEWVFYVSSDDRAAVIELEPRQKGLIEIELELAHPGSHGDRVPSAMSYGSRACGSS